MIKVAEVVEVLDRLPARAAEQETELQLAVARALTVAGIRWRREVDLGWAGRIDFLAAWGVGIECKRGPLRHALVMEQLERYALHDDVRGLVLVTEQPLHGPGGFCRHSVLCGVPLTVVTVLHGGLAL